MSAYPQPIDDQTLAQMFDDDAARMTLQIYRTDPFSQFNVDTMGFSTVAILSFLVEGEMDKKYLIVQRQRDTRVFQYIVAKSKNRILAVTQLYLDAMNIICSFHSCDGITIFRPRIMFEADKHIRFFYESFLNQPLVYSRTSEKLNFAIYYLKTDDKIPE